jgi:hypothetical protein
MGLKMPKSLSEQFIDVRDFIVESIEPMFQVYFTELWDPLSFFLITKHVNESLVDLVKEKFPDFPIKYIPQTKFVVNEDDSRIELSIQEHLNELSSEVKYLGSCGMYGHTYDLYIRPSYVAGPPVLRAKYGHEQISYVEGTVEAESDYFDGKVTPLSVAYGLARDAGYLRLIE